MKLSGRTLRGAVALLAACGALWATAVPAVAAATCPKTTELAMESKVMCQVCGVPLALANSLEANRERAFMTTLVKRCDSVSQIEAAMVVQYGPGILASPGGRGFAITAWLVPVAGILAATLAIAGVVVLGRRRRQAYELAMAVPAATADENAVLDRALKALDTRQ